jgi:hypothetical protein
VRDSSTSGASLSRLARRGVSLGGSGRQMKNTSMTDTDSGGPLRLPLSLPYSRTLEDGLVTLGGD